MSYQGISSISRFNLLKKVVFLDRDGVINQDSANYIRCWDEFVFLPRSLKALKFLTLRGYTLIVITNQSIINRGWIRSELLENTHRRMKQAVKSSGGRIFDIFFCPHTPDENCDCRKPKPGLILKACLKHDIDVSDAVMVGDSAKDILCGIAAGCGKTILVETGNGQAAQKALTQQHIFPDIVVSDLLEAAQWIAA